MAAKIKDIASKVNMSPATVSMALNNRPGISPETRDRVLEAARELNYRPVSSKRNVQNVSGMLPYIIYRKHGQVLAETPFFSSMIESIENEARRHGYQVSIHYLSHHAENCAEELRSICMGAEKGVLMMATEMDLEDCMAVSKLNVPLVLIDNSAAGVRANKVLMNNFEGTLEAISQLYGYGHRKIGYMHSAVHINNFAERESGFRFAMARNGLEVNGDWIARLDCTHEGAYRDMADYCRQAGSFPTAFFADNDIIAMGAMKALKEHGFQIPTDISIVGFDDMPFCRMVEPNLSTMFVDTQAIASIAVRMLLGDDRFFQKVEVSPTYIHRNSVKIY